MRNTPVHPGAQTRLLKRSISYLALAGLMAATGAYAQDAAPAPAAQGEDLTTVVVTGYRASLQSALNTKRKADVMLDAINAEDIADFPDANLAESLQRIPGISIDRDNGEGRTITVRGLGADFQRTRINGLEALSTAGANDSGSSPNRSRAFDYNTFASELFNSLTVRKTASAETDEGALGATIDLQTARPFDYKTDTYAFSTEAAWYQNGDYYNPRMTGLISKRWADGRLGWLGSIAYSERDTNSDQYRRQAGQSDYTYRGSTWATAETPYRAGFAAPTGTTFGTAITNAAYLAAVTGSDATAYNNLYPGCSTATTATDLACANSTVRIPALAQIQQQKIHSERLGITSSFQMKISDNTKVSVDYLGSHFENESTYYQIQTVGLNRNNTNAGLATATASTARATKRGYYPGTCTYAAETELAAGTDCGQSLYGTNLATNMWYSYNPYNLDVYDYYNNPASVGYVASTDGLAMRTAMIGRPAVKVLASHVNSAGIADYLQLQNVDWRSGADQNSYTTDFNQFSVNLDHRFNDRLSMTMILGASSSVNKNTGLLVEFNKLDSQGIFTYDERSGGNMPVFDLGFNAADSSQWSIVKGISGMRHYQRNVENTYSGLKTDFKYDHNDALTFKFGFNDREYSFETSLRERNNDLLNPTEKEAGVSVASLGQIINFGQGLDLSSGTATSFFAPNIEAFKAVFGFDCDCINKYGDWTLTSKKSSRESYEVTEHDTGTYGQADFRTSLFGRDLSGNFGVRVVQTKVDAEGANSVGRRIKDSNEYTDTLPALNLSYDVARNLKIRVGAAKVMSRPNLSMLSPSVSAISIPNTGATTGATMTVGNTKLNPYRATNYDLSVEWYFAKGSILSLALFTKDIKSYPQTVLYSAPMSTFLTADAIAALKLQYATGSVADNYALAYINGDYEVTARQYRDAPGGTLKGWEFNYEQPFTFLPGYLANTGLRLNATHIESELTYILDPGSSTVAASYGTGPWLGASPNALNFTLYYEDPKLSARISMSKREGYYTTYPIASGSCAAGTVTSGTAACDSPLVNDFEGSEGTTNVDFSSSYKFSKRLSISLEGLNLTNQTTNRQAYYANGSPVVSQYASTGMQVTLGLRYKY
ncbi:TonB-dependent receptor [Asticcacaulis sp. BYS171W]|uniref:TonB-dependent receptor n=1 Tax=Asticcacaulis aquaticus TaxID=2984212 RepID=A0ABT5HZ16_9CAUL|nr:TonB-dependent receptor [Asticcacaulis aquaticus]MDC7685178.1 TonB-dependent receptor [Asticcacaulis aquaticus]